MMWPMSRWNLFHQHVLTGRPRLKLAAGIFREEKVAVVISITEPTETKGDRIRNDWPREWPEEIEPDNIGHGSDRTRTRNKITKERVETKSFLNCKQSMQIKWFAQNGENAT